ncbi:hypothetical protein Pan216_40060 [Planctomycetes bacterium Pan216]|uniref:Uncharacterized protein n=1 Tax=Kolteria novifilia TaxID=2527975 RepID=A0A518B829_9BACT|nr:hypothetical protein Pan216_40060 [Planctomycetes bacterium Pan216]
MADGSPSPTLVEVVQRDQCPPKCTDKSTTRRRDHEVTVPRWGKATLFLRLELWATIAILSSASTSSGPVTPLTDPLPSYSMQPIRPLDCRPSRHLVSLSPFANVRCPSARKSFSILSALVAPPGAIRPDRRLYRSCAGLSTDKPEEAPRGGDFPSDFLPRAGFQQRRPWTRPPRHDH